MSELDELYKSHLDHNKSPRNYRAIANANRKAEGYNPLCGDHVTVFLQLDDGVIKDISFQGSGWRSRSVRIADDHGAEGEDRSGGP